MNTARSITANAFNIERGNYYSFGMEQPGRIDPGDNTYRYGFNGMEKDDEIDGVSGSKLDFGARVYDSRLGRWLSVDPLWKNYPTNSDYSFALNNPILLLDPDGQKVVVYSEKSKKLVISMINYAFGSAGGFSFDGNNLIHDGSVPQNMTNGQQLMFKYFTETAVQSSYEIQIKSDVDFIAYNDEFGLTSSSVSKNGATTQEVPRINFYKKLKARGATHGIYQPAKSIIGLSPGLLENGGGLMQTDGLIDMGDGFMPRRGITYLTFNSEHFLLHEIAHAMLNYIMTDLGGEYNGINFNELSDEEIDDWAIRFTNTLNHSKGANLETGDGQHNRASGDAPDKEQVAPLKK